MKLSHVCKSGATLLAVGLCSPLSSPTACAAEPRPPDILVIIADDLGYGDISWHGGKIPTPHLDSIAKNGISFREGYVTAPQCVPSRAALMTGRYQQRFGLESLLSKINGIWTRGVDFVGHRGP